MTVNSISNANYNNTSLYHSNSSNDKPTETSINKENGYYGFWEKAKDIVPKHYEKMYKENMSFADPMRHISDKYCNRMSPWFRHDMTEEERRLASANEAHGIRTSGKSLYMSCNINDYSLRTLRGLETPLNVEIEDYKKIQHNRTAITTEINRLFKENNIYIPLDASLKFSINPYDFTITVAGLEDGKLEKRIEELLNVGENGKNLFFHLYQAARKSGDSNQMTQEKLDKFNLYGVIRQETGYDLRTLKNETGRFYTEDGRDILDLFRYNSNIPAAYRGDVVEHYTPFLLKYGKLGFNNTEDMFLSIEYKNRELYDIGQSKGYGPGQNSWVLSL
jgi:hypothetical protein